MKLPQPPNWRTYKFINHLIPSNCVGQAVTAATITVITQLLISLDTIEEITRVPIQTNSSSREVFPIRKQPTETLKFSALHNNMARRAPTRMITLSIYKTKNTPLALENSPKTDHVSHYIRTMTCTSTILLESLSFSLMLTFR